MVCLSANGGSPKIFCRGCPTSDWTCVRDYVHVLDFVRSHVLAATALVTKALQQAINVGSGFGCSVRELIHEILSQKDSRLISEV